MKMICATMALFMLIAGSVAAQDSEGLTASTLQEPLFNFSHKETAYFTLNDSTELKGQLKKVKRRRGLVKAVRMRDDQGKRHLFKGKVIKKMYLPKSQFVSSPGSTNLANCHRDLDKRLIADEYTYFEQANLQVKKKSKS